MAVLNTRIKQKHDTAENWSKATNFIPQNGELIVYDADDSNPSPRFKVGNGIDKVNDLPFSDDYIWAAIEGLPTKAYIEEYVNESIIRGEW